MTSAVVDIRPVRPEEHAAVADLVLRAYRSAGVLGPDDSYAGVVADVTGRAAVADVHVATGADGKLLGTVTTARAGQPYADVATAGELEMRMLAVEPAAAGRGIGRTLVDFCDSLAVAGGEHALVASVIDSNVGALAMYDRLGFRRRPERDVRPVPDVLLLVLTRDAGA
ncbi:MAG: GNAT family N-acetyltransferase [Actinomycetes bacterium]